MARSVTRRKVRLLVSQKNKFKTPWQGEQGGLNDSHHYEHYPWWFPAIKRQVYIIILKQQFVTPGAICSSRFFFPTR